MISMKGFGKRLRELRKKRKMTQLDLAEKLKISMDTLRRWENDRRFPRTEELLVICKMFGVSSDYMIGLTEENSKIAEMNRQGFAIGRKVFLEIPEGATDEEVERMLRLSGIANI